MANENLVGKKLGDYIIRDKLTSGGMAHIYLGEDEKLQRQAAIKILTPDMAGDDRILHERFEREARAVAKLEHDSIVPIYQFGEEGNLYFIAMRYIEGNDLADEIKKYRDREELMPVERMLSIIEQTAGALDHAHKRGIIHRDVKPSNILLRRPTGDEKGDKAVLTDFGLVLWEDVDKTLGTAFGTPRYISPEQATDSQSAVPQSDIYSLAVIVYEILTGQSLFTGKNPMEIALSHITEPPKPPRAHNPEIPVDAQREILKALQKDSEKRHTTAMRFVQALKEAYNLHETGTRPPQAPKSQYATKPIRDDLASGNVLDSWESKKSVKPATVMTQDNATDKIPLPKAIPVSKTNSNTNNKDFTKERSKSKLPIALITTVLVGAIGIVLAMTLLGGGSDNGQSANGNMQIYYNEDFFAIINLTENVTLNVRNMRVEGASGASSQRLGNDLEPGECHFVKRGGVSDSSIPDDWNCEGVAISNESGDDLFWRAEDETDETFTIQNLVNNVVNDIATCDTVGRIIGNSGDNSCRIDWTDFTTGE
ncbi:MAG: hypothetical protein Phog2KO_39940 [Phototrophicaceae bacterium]